MNVLTLNTILFISKFYIQVKKIYIIFYLQTFTCQKAGSAGRLDWFHIICEKPCTANCCSRIFAEPSCRPRDFPQPGVQYSRGTEGSSVPSAVCGTGSDGTGQLRTHAGPKLSPHGAASRIYIPAHAAPAWPPAQQHHAEPAKPAAAPAAAQTPGTAGTSPSIPSSMLAQAALLTVPTDCQLARKRPGLKCVPVLVQLNSTFKLKTVAVMSFAEVLPCTLFFLIFFASFHYFCNTVQEHARYLSLGLTNSLSKATVVLFVIQVFPCLLDLDYLFQ